MCDAFVFWIKCTAHEYDIQRTMHSYNESQRDTLFLKFIW